MIKWTYVDDEMPPVNTELLLTITEHGLDEPYVATGEYHQHPNLGTWWDIHGEDSVMVQRVIAWQLAPEPAALREKDAVEGA